MVPRVGLQCVIVVFPDHTHLGAGADWIYSCDDQFKAACCHRLLSDIRKMSAVAVQR